MVAAEERKMAAQKKAKVDATSSGKQTHPNEKEAKNKIISESKSAGKVDHKEAEEPSESE